FQLRAGHLSRCLCEPLRRGRRRSEWRGGRRTLRQRLCLSPRLRMLLAQRPAHLPLTDVTHPQQIAGRAQLMRCDDRRTEMTNKIAMTMRRFALCAAPLVLVSSFAGAPVRAQDAAVPAPAQTQTQTQASFSQAQIAQLVAPIALYPDP